MILTIIALEEDLIPAQGVGDTLHIYTGDTVITHDVRRTLEVFDGHINEAIERICAFVRENVAPSAKPRDDAFQGDS